MVLQRNPFSTTKYLRENTRSHQLQREEISECEDFAHVLFNRIEHLNLHIAYLKCIIENNKKKDRLNYFWNSMYVQRTYCTIGLCALFDPPRKGKNQNITFPRLLKVNKFNNEIVSEVGRIISAIEPLRYCRNKIYAHIDQEQELNVVDPDDVSNLYPYDALFNEFEATKCLLKAIGKGEIVNNYGRKQFLDVEFSDYKYNVEELDTLINTNVKKTNTIELSKFQWLVVRKMNSLPLMVFFAQLLFFNASLAQNNFTDYCASILKKQLKDYIRDEEKMDGFKEYKQYVVVIPECDTNEFNFSFSLNYICNDFNIEDVVPNFLIHYDKYEVLVRIEDSLLVESLLNEFNYMPFTKDMMPAPFDSVTASGRKRFPRYILCHTVRRIIYVENRKIKISEGVATYEEWRNHPEISRYSKYKENIFEKVGTEIIIDTLTEEQFNREIMGK